MRITGRVPHDDVPRWLSAADVVCGPALIEPFGQALLEGMACGCSVVATRVGGPPEFVPPEAGVLVDPLDAEELLRALETAASLPSPNEAARAAAAGTTSGCRWGGWRRFSSEPFEIGEPDLDQRPHGFLEAVLPGELQRLLVARADLLRGNPLLQPVVAGQEVVVNLAPGFVLVHVVSTVLRYGV